MGRRSCSFASSASRASRNWFLRRLLISRPFRRSNRGPCALSHGRPSSPTPRNRGHGISYVRAFSLCLSSLQTPFVGCFHQNRDSRRTPPYAERLVSAGLAIASEGLEVRVLVAAHRRLVGGLLVLVQGSQVPQALGEVAA